MIELGGTVREQQTIINIPDITQMKIDCRIHESHFQSIQVGKRASTIKVRCRRFRSTL